MSIAVTAVGNADEWFESHEFNEWRVRGACNGLDPTIFYPDDEDNAIEAKEICEECSVRIACLEHALASREKEGVWGGATAKERRRIIRQRRRSA
jgi:WhiB family transcriptional regulator, redox-sensing transcriptional regulator